MIRNIAGQTRGSVRRYSAEPQHAFSSSASGFVQELLGVFPGGTC